MTMKDLRAATGMTQKAFAEYFAIPRRTLEDWERGLRQYPDYLFKLMHYKLQQENLLRAE